MAEAARMDYMTYGRTVNMPQLTSFIKNEMELNRQNFHLGLRRRVPCIWGPPGIGKTDIVKQLKKDGYVIKHVPLAQFEEMGDLNGIPREQQDKHGNWTTVTCPPEWVPNLERDGSKVVLLLDDMNRADTRIVKGTMQLIQDYGMTSWTLDQPDWHIICTANPEGGLNDVTPLDPAQVSRFTHITLKVEGEDGVRSWALWAQQNKVDNRAISFMLKSPAMLFANRDRVNPRTWTQAFDIMRLVTPQSVGERLTKDEAERISTHVEACVDKEAASAFMVFLTKGILELIEPEDLLNDLDKQMPKLMALSGNSGGQARADCLFAIYERLYLYIRSDGYVVKEGEPQTSKQGLNFVKLMSHDELAAKDMRWAIIRRLHHGDSDVAKEKTRILIRAARAADKSASDKLVKMLADVLVM